MAQISGNTCNILTITPLEVECVVTNSATPLTPNGSVQVLINGGTGPYSVSWSNGQQGSTLIGLLPGTYSATITDYYGDYTTTTKCVVEYDSFYLDKLLECAEISSPNVYVFYDGTSLDEVKATQASNSIREWYSGKTDEGFGGLLYEGVVGETSNNGENWLWWGTYPYLGSLTGGTLSDNTPVEIFGLNGESVTNSVSTDPRWCKNTLGPCIPKNVSFNFKNTTYQRINRGLNLNNGSSDSRSQGVPFNAPSSLDGLSSGIYGGFNGGDTNYIVICVVDEADGGVGLYHGRVGGNSSNPIKSDLYNYPFVLKGTGWDTSNSLAPSDRYVGDYEGFLQVWEDIVINQNGSFNGLIYPVCDSATSRIPFVQHSVATIEGDTISSSEYTTKYGGSITNVGPENLNLSALTRTNVYTALTTNSVYTSLPIQYKQGSGLKNFGWQVDPDVTNFTSTVVGDTLDDFFENIQIGDNAIYITQGNTFNPSLIYSFNEIDGCYQFDSTVLWTNQTYSAVTVNNSYNDCIECQPVTPNPPTQPDLCLSNDTTQYTFTANGTDSNGNYVWVNTTYSLTMSYNTITQKWEISNWLSVGSGTMGLYQNPPSIPLGSWINYGVSTETAWTVTQGECEGIPLSVTSVTSDPSCIGNTGTVTLTGNGGTPPYQYTIPGVISTLQNSGIFTNLLSGTYSGVVQDSSANTATTTFTIGTGTNSVQYSMSISTTNSQTTTGTNTVTKSYNYSVNVSPSLPSGTSIVFTLRLGHTQERAGVVNGNGSGDVTFSKNFVVSKNGGLITTNDSVLTSSSGPVCGSTKYIDSYQTNSVQITMTSGDVVNGSVSQTTTLNNLTTNCDCKTYGDYDTSLQVMNPTLNGTSCESLNSVITPITTEAYVENCQSSCSTYMLTSTVIFSSTIFRYFDCNGQLQQITIGGGQVDTVCAQSLPTLVVSNTGIVSLYSNNCS